jgi:hypothetical protein
MAEYPHINKSPEQLREMGACGGRANPRNQRARRALVATPPEVVPPPALPQQTTAEAIHVLDAQFPWLRGAERKRSRNREWVPAPASVAVLRRATKRGWRKR